MKFSTSSFGEIDIDESKIITFDEGLPGFFENKQYVVLGPPKALGLPDSSPFLWLQSLNDGETAFILLNPFSVFPDYDPRIIPADIASIGDSADDVLIYNMVVVPEDVRKMSVNLAAPVIINQRTKKGRQALSPNADYGIKHYLFENGGEL